MEPDLTVLGLAGLLVIACLLTPFSSFLRIPLSLALSVAGAVLGYFVHVHEWAPGWLAEYLEALTAFEISSEAILIIFLPVLLFESSLSMNVRRLMNDIGPVMIMAVVAVCISTLLIGWGAWWASPQSLAACLLMGAIVATTDPAAVVSIFKDVGAPKRLSLIVEGESLLNDAAAIALYSALLVLAARDTAIHWNFLPLIISFSTQLFGGIILGYLLGRVTCLGFLLLRGRPTAEISLSVAAAYITYVVGEHYVGVSGVVTTVVAGLTISLVGRARVAASTFRLLDQSWSQLGFWASSLVFILAAMTIPKMMADVGWDDLFVIVTMMVMALVARVATVFGVVPLTQFLGAAPVNRAYKTVIAWGGLRGAISLTLALSVTEHPALSEEIRRFVAVGATGFVLSTLLINGLTLRWLIRFLKLDALTNVQQALRNQAEIVTVTNLKTEVDDLAKSEQISLPTQQAIDAVFVRRIQEKQMSDGLALDAITQLRVGLIILAQHEYELLLSSRRHDGMDVRTVDLLLNFAQNVEDAVSSEGLQGYEQLVERSLRYTPSLSWLLRVHHRAGLPRWLGRKLGQRFIYLMANRLVVRRLITFNRKELTTLVGEQTVHEIDRVLTQRLQRIEDHIKAMRLQFPTFALWLEQVYLAHIAQSLELSRYHKMLDSSLISAEVYDTLIEEATDVWSMFDHMPQVDSERAVPDILAGVRPFKHLSQDQRLVLAQCFESVQVTPDEWVVAPDAHAAPLYLIASGAVSLHLENGKELLLGSGEFFGQAPYAFTEARIHTVHAMGYSRLLVMQPARYEALLGRDPTLNLSIETALKSENV
ncbi:cation:proton antiporter [Orrella sp. 11846]|uniref:cation:proton antiporter n=1 Tax=Orrella sp. 11846 TaxID=3409913 RepID=UPI003B590C0A